MFYFTILYHVSNVITQMFIRKCKRILTVFKYFNRTGLAGITEILLLLDQYQPKILTQVLELICILINNTFRLWLYKLTYWTTWIKNAKRAQNQSQSKLYLKWRMHFKVIALWEKAKSQSIIKLRTFYSQIILDESLSN